jgi:GNAT superfamily N-acetyltransferase
MNEAFTIRQATLADLDTIVTHRQKMFEDMGATDQSIHAAFAPAFKSWVRERLENDRYHEWFVVTPAGQIIAGTGLWLMDWPPRYGDSSPFRGYILNVYTEPAFRRKGLARWLMQTVLDWCTANGVKRVTLHYSDEGKFLYESMGFEKSNEMRFNLPSE